ncbi:MAG: hypothetical protein BWX80_00475 [Candidatus Hydrogenedentes bacterium ADurb.Bin101]|jgi:hypothetical protein|nr:MAG: hypothetical protein BWX80_00475 [Candidatus Hydrogenedentes bacterium ADurb.Bin101]
MRQKESVSKPPKQFSLGKTVIYSLLPALVLFGAIEGCARLLEIWRPPLAMDYGWGFNEGSRVFEPGGMLRNKMVTRPEKVISFPKQSFDMPKPADVYRMIIIGGSNVNYMQHNLYKMASRLSHTSGEQRRFEIINCGGCAYGSTRLRNLVPELLAYDPDVMLIYSGHNEFEEQIHKALVDVQAIPAQKAAYSLAMLRLLRDGLASLQLTCLDVQQLRETVPPEIDASTGMYAFSMEEIEAHMNLYRENLVAILSLCRERKVPVIISTVASNFWKPQLHHSLSGTAQKIQTLYDEGKYEEGMTLARETLARSPRHQASDTENGIIREVAQQFSLPLIEGEKLIMEAEPHGVPGETLLGDHCHLTDTGREIVLRAFEKEIRRVAATGG